MAYVRHRLDGIPPEHSTLASLLKSASYRTAWIGKWHAGYLPHYDAARSGGRQPVLGGLERGDAAGARLWTGLMARP
jgi:arylsulfatase A-like enzyme